MKSKFLYFLTYIGLWLLAIIPFSVLYILSDFIYFWIYYIIRYRRKVVSTNLKNSFPEKSATELKNIERRFYHYLCDYMLEDAKLLRMSEKELSKHMTYENTETYLRMIEERGGIVVLIPHYANFEWLIGMGSIMRHGDLPVQVYKPLKDAYLDGIFKYIRSRFGGYNVPKHSTAREVVRLKHAGKKMAIGLITDQSPNDKEAHYWTTFLNQDTVFMDGAERIAKMMNFPVFYSELSKERRGYCSVEFELLIENPKETVDGEITEIFARRLEQTIRKDPAYWLWSHKRWKLKRPQKNNE